MPILSTVAPDVQATTSALTVYDHGMIVFYLAFMISIGWVVRRFNTSSSDYFRGGGNMLWWMTGSSAFMVSFSAVLFTGMAGKAYVDGSIVLVIYVANFLGFVFNYLWTAHRFRQMRVDTPMEAVRDRYGRINEQFFSWIQIPLSILYAGIWLYGLGVFLTAAFGLPLEVTLIVVGVVVVLMSALGGAWAVVASDFMQVLTLMPITLVAAFLALQHPAVGGVSGFFEKLPEKNFDWSLVARSQIVWLWVIAAFLQKFVSTNNMLDSSRYLCAKNTAHARKAALFGTILNFFGPMIWFIPPLAAAIVFTDLRSNLPRAGRESLRGGLRGHGDRNHAPRHGGHPALRHLCRHHVVDGQRPEPQRRHLRQKLLLPRAAAARVGRGAAAGRPYRHPGVRGSGHPRGADLQLLQRPAHLRPHAAVRGVGRAPPTASRWCWACL